MTICHFPLSIITSWPFRRYKSCCREYTAVSVIHLHYLSSLLFCYCKKTVFLKGSFSAFSRKTFHSVTAREHEKFSERRRSRIQNSLSVSVNVVRLKRRLKLQFPLTSHGYSGTTTLWHTTRLRGLETPLILLPVSPTLGSLAKRGYAIRPRIFAKSSLRES